MILRTEDLSLDALQGMTVAVIGFGSQGSAQAQNLRESGVSVLVGVRNGNSRSLAESLGFRTEPISEACVQGDIISVLLPERSHAEVATESINRFAREGTSLVFAHGYTQTYSPELFRSDLKRLLVAPKAIGPQLRTLYENGKGAAALIAAEPGDIEIAKSYAMALGCGRVGVIVSSFKEETETDLFGEQAVLCGGLPSLALAGFETLVNAGYQPEVAYFECLFEIKLIADMLIQHGVSGMIDRISDTAQFGAMTAGPKVITEGTRDSMKILLEEIQSGAFAESFRSEQATGSAEVVRWRESLRRNQLEQMHRTLNR